MNKKEERLFTPIKVSICFSLCEMESCEFHLLGKIIFLGFPIFFMESVYNKYILMLVKFSLVFIQLSLCKFNSFINYRETGSSEFVKLFWLFSRQVMRMCSLDFCVYITI